MKDYRNEVLNFLEDTDIENDIVMSDYENLNAVADHLRNIIAVDCWPGQTDEEREKETDRRNNEIYNTLVKECAEDCYKGELKRQILDIFWEDAELMEFYNNNIWDIYGELNEVFDNTEDLEQINKNLGGKGVTKICL